MREDITLPDLVAFYLAAFMLAAMIFSLLVLLSLVFRSANGNTNPDASALVKQRRRGFQRSCTVFNVCLVGMILGSSMLVASILVSVSQSHFASHVRGSISFGTFGGSLFESCYCVYSWYRSKSILEVYGRIIYWSITALVVVNPIVFSAQVVASILFDYRILSRETNQIVSVVAVAGLFILDVGLLSCFVNFLVKNPAPTNSTGRFNGNKEAERKWNRTDVIARYGAISCSLSFVGLVVMVVSQLFRSVDDFVNLLHACAYSLACLGSVTLLKMKVELEAKGKNNSNNNLDDHSGNQLEISRAKKSQFTSSIH